MPKGKWRRRPKHGRFELLGSKLAWLRANFQVATQEQRVSWFGTSDRDQFERVIGRLHAKGPRDLDAQLELDRLIGNVRDHVLKLVKKTED